MNTAKLILSTIAVMKAIRASARDTEIRRRLSSAIAELEIVISKIKDTRWRIK